MTCWTSHGFRGRITEELINLINDYYEKRGIALVKKIPTPVKVQKIEKGKIVEGFFEEKSTVDYYGVINGCPVAFDAKETKKKRFPLNQIGSHQMIFLEKFQNQKGAAFIICNYTTMHHWALIPLEVLKGYYTNGPKSIPYNCPDLYTIPFNKSGLPDYAVSVAEYTKTVIPSWAQKHG